MGEKKTNSLLVAASYLLLLLAVFAALSVYFAKGISSADDLHCHLAQCYDVYYGLKNGFSLPTSNHLIYGTLGGNMIESYAPLPHYAVGLFYYLFEWAGADVISSYKIITILVEFLGGVFMYHFVMRVTGKRLYGFLAGVFFAIAPCRTFLAICRASYSEMWGLSFLPLLFDGVYSLLKSTKYDRKWYVPYLKIVISVTVILYSHILSALLGVTACAFYILFHYEDVYRLYKEDHSVYWKVPATVVATVLLTLPYLIPSLSASFSGVYRVSDKELFGSTYANIVKEMGNDLFHSGLRIFTTAANFSGGDSVASVTFGLLLLLFVALALPAIDISLRKWKKCKGWLRLLIEVATFVVLGLVGPVHLEYYFALVAYFLVYHLVALMLSRQKKEAVVAEETGASKVELLYFFLSALFTLVLIYVPWIWKAIPSIYYSVQFPFRLFVYLAFFLSAFVPMLLSQVRLKSTTLAPVSALLVCLCLYFDQAAFEKRNDSAPYYTSFSATDCLGAKDGGVQKEYVPISLLDDDYESPYGDASLLDEVNNALKYNHYSLEESSYLSPVALEGGISSYTLTHLNTPEVSYTITVTGDSYIQMGQIYYSGYAIRVIDENGKTSHPQALNQDGLLAYRIGSGTYAIYVTYPGSPAVQTASVFAYLTLSGIALSLAGGASLFSHLRKRGELACR